MKNTTKPPVKKAVPRDRVTDNRKQFREKLALLGVKDRRAVSSNVA